MSTISLTVRDSITMFQRTMRHILRNAPGMVGALGTPIFILLMMVYVFGGAMENGRTNYINYVVPGMLLITVIQGSGMVAVRLNTDMSRGIIARFRTMAISRAAVLNGHVGGGVLGILLNIVVITGLAVAIGFRPNADLAGWLGALGIITLFSIAITLLVAAIGLAIKSVDGVNTSLFPIYMLPFFSSALAPTDTMPAAMAWFARYQPFTPIIETVRGLLMGTPIGNNGIVAISWCIAIIVASFLWARSLFNRMPT